VQSPVSLGDSSEPEPDVALLKPRPDYYERSHPRAADVLLVIEVAEASLGISTVKVRMAGPVELRPNTRLVAIYRRC